ncbi:MAG: AzlD domain-containing protein [Treponema sp.]|nr:AzlD domain-containing protein [Treponema sp.]
MSTLQGALLLTFAMGLVILFCRAFPFLFFSRKDNIQSPFFTFVEKTVPPVAMTVLALNAIGGSLRESLQGGSLTLIAAIFTAAIHLWKRNALLSIIGGTILYMILIRVISVS